MAKDDGKDKPEFYYAGFSTPNYTQLPNDVTDVLMPHLTEAELKVLLYIVRRTFGFGKNADAISLNQMIDGITTRDGRVLDSGTGLSRSSVRRGIAGLEAKGIIVIRKVRSEEGDYETNVYGLRFQSDTGVVPESNHPAEGVVSRQNHPGSNLKRGVVPPQNPQETVEQEIDRQETQVEYSTVTPSDFDEIGARMALLPFVEDFGREFNDQAPLRSSVSRMVNLYRKSGLSEDEFINVLYAARTRTKEYSASIKAQAVGDGWNQRKPKMAYFFSIVTDMVGAPAGESESEK